MTAGRVYSNVIKKEREGKYLGSTVQVIPHVTDEIKTLIKRGSKGADISFVEVGGTVGDIESLPFLESIRQLNMEMQDSHTLFIHLTLLPLVEVTNEIKTKPTQHSVKELRSIGIHPMSYYVELKIKSIIILKIKYLYLRMFIKMQFSQLKMHLQYIKYLSSIKIKN